MKKTLAIIVFFFLAFVSISFNRHWRYQSQGNDLALFDQSAWLYSKSLTPYNTITKRLDYQDRYKPIMPVLGFIYRFFPGPYTLLFLQGFFLAFSGLFIYLIARRLKLSLFVATIVTTLYLSFPGITSFLIDDFHEVSLFPFFFLGAVYFFLTNRRFLFIICLVFSLVIRDYLVVFSVVFWLFFLLTHQGRLLKLTVAIHIIMLTFMILTLKLTGGIQYGAFTEEGDGLFSVFIKFLTNPSLLFSQFFSPFPKLVTFFTSLGYFLFIPILSFWAIVPIVFQFAGRFYDLVHPYRWAIAYHYSGELAALLALATVFKLSHWPKRRQLIIVSLMAVSSLMIIKYHHSPLTLLVKPEFWWREPWMDNNDALVKLIPPVASVAAQSNLTPHLSNRVEIYILPKVPPTDFVLIDLHKNQDKYNFNGLDDSGMHKLQLRIESEHKLVKQIGDSYLYQRK